MKEDGSIESRIQQAMRSRVQHFRDQADSLTFEGVRRLLEKDLALDTYALDVHKRYVKQLLEKYLSGTEDDENVSKGSEQIKSEQVKEEEEERPKEHKVTDIRSEDEGKIEDSPVMGLLLGNESAKSGNPETHPNAKDNIPTEDVINEAIWKRATYFRSKSEELTVACVRRLLEDDLELKKFSLDSFKKLINKQLEEVLNSQSETPQKTESKSDAGSSHSDRDNIKVPTSVGSNIVHGIVPDQPPKTDLTPTAGEMAADRWFRYDSDDDFVDQPPCDTRKSVPQAQPHESSPQPQPHSPPPCRSCIRRLERLERHVKKLIRRDRKMKDELAAIWRMLGYQCPIQASSSCDFTYSNIMAEAVGRKEPDDDVDMIADFDEPIEQAAYGAEYLSGTEDDENVSEQIKSEQVKEEEEERPKEHKVTDIRSEDSPVMGLLSGNESAKSGNPETQANAKDNIPTEDVIKEAIWKRTTYFRSKSEELTVVGVRRLLEDDLELKKFSLDSFKKLITKQLEEALNSHSETPQKTESESDAGSSHSDVPMSEGPKKRKRPAKETPRAR